jgi:tetratricopeptide (TPR) repeat protein
MAAQQPDPAALQRYFEQGNKALAEGRYAEAEAAYEKLLESSPGIAEVHASLGFTYYQQGKLTEAVATLQQAIKLKPGLPNVEILLAMSLSELGRYAEALPGLENGFKQSGDAALKRMSGLQLQRAYTGLARDREAVEVALQLMRLYPDDPEILYHASRLYANFSYLTLQKLSDVAPASVWRRQAAGEAFESQGSYELAIQEYREVLALDPGRPGIRYRIGRALLAGSRDANAAAAAKEFEQELEVDATNANAAYELGEIHRKSGRHGEAQKLFEQALRSYPDFEEARLGLAGVLIAQGKHGLALPHLEKAIALNPANEVAYFRLAQVHRALGNPAEQKKALAEFQRLRGEKSSQEKSLLEAFSPDAVTKQQVEAEAGP